MAMRRITLDGEFAGMWCEMRTDVSARILIDLESGKADRAMSAFARLVLAHNLTGLDGEKIDDVLDAPIGALMQAVQKWSEAQTLPQA